MPKDCLKFQEQFYSYLDGMLDTVASARLEEHLAHCSGCKQALAEAKALENDLKMAFAMIEPPQDFSAKVMASLPAKPLALEAKKTKILEFPRRGVWTGVGTVAAALAIVIGVSTLASNVPVTPPNMADNTPAIQTPAAKDDSSGKGSKTQDDTAVANKDNTDKKTTNGNGQTIASTDHNKGNATGKPTTNGSGSTANHNVTTGAGTSALPQASFGTKTVGSLNMRLVANYDSSDIYGIETAEKNTVSFYTYQNSEFDFWNADLVNAVKPECLTTTTVKDETTISSELQNACPTYNTNTVIFSPDKSLQASNVRGDNKGLWIASSDGSDPYLLSSDAGGKLLAWSPNGSKILFTDTDGNLYVGYPLEKQVFQVYSGHVQDVLWFSDNQTIAFLVQENGKTYNSLFTAQVP